MIEYIPASHIMKEYLFEFVIFNRLSPPAIIMKCKWLTPLIHQFLNYKRLEPMTFWSLTYRWREHGINHDVTVGTNRTLINMFNNFREDRFI